MANPLSNPSVNRPLEVMNRQQPEQIVFSPNLWQWHAHHRNHGIQPAELSRCENLLDVYRHLGTDVWSRNCYCDERRCWFGGLSEPEYGNVSEKVAEHMEGKDLVIEKAYRTPAGILTERLRYVFAESTLSQEKFLFDDYEHQIDAMESMLRQRRWRFVPERFRAIQARIGEGGMAVAGEVYSPLKLLHLIMGPIDTTYLLEDMPERAAGMLRHHEEASLDLIGQMLRGGVKVVMSMDNLDSVFHPPRYDAFAYVEELFRRMRPYSHRFIFSASCNIPYTASWDMIVNLRDAWANYRRLS